MQGLRGFNVASTIAGIINNYVLSRFVLVLDDTTSGLSDAVASRSKKKKTLIEPCAAEEANFFCNVQRSC